MSFINEITSALKRLVSWWVVITPWEQAVRVRLGKHVSMLDAGIHWRFPLIDLIYKQSIRLRYTDLPVQTITTADGKTVTLSGTVGYVIKDIKLLYETLHHADDTIMNLAMAKTAKCVRSKRLENCKAEEIERSVSESMNLNCYGLGDVQFSLLEFAEVRTFRVIQANKWSQGDTLVTTQECRQQVIE